MYSKATWVLIYVRGDKRFILKQDFNEAWLYYSSIQGENQ